MLIASVASKKLLKGQLVHVQDEPASWGNMETFPAYVILTVTNSGAAPFRQFMARWKTAFRHEVTTNPDQSSQVRVTISQRITEIFGDTRGIQVAMQTRLVSVWGATIITFTPTLLVFDAPQGTNLLALQADLLDLFEEQLGPQYVFSNTDVDAAIAAGGALSMKRSAAMARMADRSV